MPQRCSVPFCCNYGGHQFPKDKQRRFQWRVAIKRLDPLTKKLWEPNDRDVVCHLHFVAAVITRTPQVRKRIYIDLAFFVSC